MTFWYSNNQHIYKTGDIVKLTKASYYVTPHDNLMFLRYSEETNMCYVIHKTRDGIRCWNLGVTHIVPSESTECRFSDAIKETELRTGCKLHLYSSKII